MSFRILKFILKKLIKSRSILIKTDETEYLIDNGNDPLILRINNKNFLKKIYYAPSLVLTEGYMDKDYELENTSFSGHILQKLRSRFLRNFSTFHWISQAISLYHNHLETTPITITEILRVSEKELLPRWQ